jgi:hypothetical protein
MSRKSVIEFISHRHEIKIRFNNKSATGIHIYMYMKMTCLTSEEQMRDRLHLERLGTDDVSFVARANC